MNAKFTSSVEVGIVSPDPGEGNTYELLVALNASIVLGIIVHTTLC